MQQKFDAVCTFYCPLKEGDIIHGLCVIGSDGKLHLSRPPFVQLPTDRNHTIQSIKYALKLTYVGAQRVFNKIASFAGGEESIIPFLTGLAQSWYDTRNTEILFLFGASKPEQIKTLLEWWYQQRNLRSLYLLGLNNKEIYGARVACDQIHTECLKNPYTLPSLPLEKCDEIMDRLNKRPDPIDRIRGSIMRVLWRHLTQNGWTGTPSRILARQFPDIKNHIDALKHDYGLVAEMGTAYLEFPHRVEVWMANYLTQKRLSDPITYETPLDTPVEVAGGQTITRVSAQYTREMSSDQQQAIQGALDHTISVITGGAGTGKCLAPGTKVLMADGRRLRVETIRPGNALMGPDSTPRMVRSTCTGLDQMFEIKPIYGRPFICNQPHVLTLHGLEPRIKDRTVLYTRRGVRVEQTFETEAEARAYAQNLSPDIFDVPLDQYLTWPQSVQDECHLYHVGVEYPEGPVAGPLDCSALMSIPSSYLINSRAVRRDVLNRFLDLYGYNEGHITKVRHIHSRLTRDLETLALSLGLMAHPVGSELWIWGPHHGMGTRSRFIIRPLGEGPYVGFELSGDGRFLLGDFTVTHNTTCISQIIHNLELRGTSYVLCAFTGKAVARIREVTDKKTPATIHRLIAKARTTDLTKYGEIKPQYEHVIIDEASMVEIELLYKFLQAHPTIKRLTLVGDADQLEPIGWGCVFSQIIKSETVPVYRLTTNYRVYTVNGERDGIILNANAIIHHDPTYPFEFSPTSNFSIVEGPIQRVYDILRGCFASGVTPSQLVVISPYNDPLTELNAEFQRIYDVGANSITDSRGTRWMIGDRVMLTQNDATTGIANGEGGSIRDVSPRAILVEFGTHGIFEFLLEPPLQANTSYRARENSDENYENDKVLTVLKLKHAYAITVDKSQGSEWDFVIFCVLTINAGSFLNSNRGYTAITRAKRACWLVVSEIEPFQSVIVQRPPFRCQNLDKRLEASLPKLRAFQSQPAVEFEGTLPYDVPADAFDFGIDYDDYD
jgi:hypothetical protein